MASGDTRPHGLVRAMGLWDVILFNVAAVVGPRWVANAAHAGPSSIALWMLAAVLFFVPSAFMIVELSTRYPHVGGFYVWTREAFGPFHGFVSGWCYWTYTIVYFPALLNASLAMAVYIGGARYAGLAQNKPFLVLGGIVFLAIAVGFNLVGVGVGKWLQNVGAVMTFVPLALLVLAGALFAVHFGSATPLTRHSMSFRLDWGTVNYWSQIAFALSGMELIGTLSEEIHEPQRTFPRSILIAGIAIVAIYVLGTMGTLAILQPGAVDIRAGAIQALTVAASRFGFAWAAIIIAMLLAVGNIGGVGSTVAGVARVPFAAGIDRYLPRAFGHIHPRWRTPWVAMLVQAALAAILLALSQIGDSVYGAYLVLVDATTIMYFIPLLYMFASLIALRRRPDRGADPRHSLVPGGQIGVWIVGLLGAGVTVLALAFSLVPPSDIAQPALFDFKLVVICVGLIGAGLLLYARSGRRIAGTAGVN